MWRGGANGQTWASLLWIEVGTMLSNIRDQTPVDLLLNLVTAPKLWRRIERQARARSPASRSGGILAQDTSQLIVGSSYWLDPAT